MQRVFVIMITVLCIISMMGSVSVLGVELNPSEAAEPSDVSDRLDITVSDICTGHEYFYQISATEQGSFIVVSRYTDIKEDRDLVYKQHYMDVYSPEGVFLAELSFCTEQDFAAELTNDAVILYFYDYIIVYDYFTGKLHSYPTSPGESIENGTYERLKKTDFELGGWRYHCKKGFHGYSQLTRTNGSMTQTISFDGNQLLLRNTILPGVLSAGVILAIFVFIKRKKTGIDSVS